MQPTGLGSPGDSVTGCCSDVTERKTHTHRQPYCCVQIKPWVPLTLWKMCAPWKEMSDAWKACVIYHEMFPAQGMTARQITVLKSVFSSSSHHQLFSLPPALSCSALLGVGGWARGPPGLCSLFSLPLL